MACSKLRHIALSFLERGIEKECNVCYQGYTRATIQITACGHIFCANCLLKVQTCPTCRTVLTQEMPLVTEPAVLVDIPIETLGEIYLNGRHLSVMQAIIHHTIGDRHLEQFFQRTQIPRTLEVTKWVPCTAYASYICQLLRYKLSVATILDIWEKGSLSYYKFIKPRFFVPNPKFKALGKVNLKIVVFIQQALQTCYARSHKDTTLENKMETRYIIAILDICLRLLQGPPVCCCETVLLQPLTAFVGELQL